MKKLAEILLDVLILIDIILYFEFPHLCDKYGGIISGFITILAVVGIGIYIKEHADQNKN